MRFINKTKKYWNQYFDVTDVIKTPEYEPYRTCNVTCVAMITGEHPDKVLQYFFNEYGLQIGVKSPRYQWQEELIKYLQTKGYKCEKILKKDAYPKARRVTDDELKKMVQEIKNGKVIFYHKKGHYQLMVGFVVDGDNMDFVFNDPAGDRKIGRSLRKRESGHNVVYPMKMVKSEVVYGQCYSVDIGAMYASNAFKNMFKKLWWWG